MGTTADKLAYNSNALNDMASAINEKGGGNVSVSPLANWAQAIRDIPSGGPDKERIAISGRLMWETSQVAVGDFPLTARNNDYIEIGSARTNADGYFSVPVLATEAEYASGPWHLHATTVYDDAEIMVPKTTFENDLNGIVMGLTLLYEGD